MPHLCKIDNVCLVGVFYTTAIRMFVVILTGSNLFIYFFQHLIQCVLGLTLSRNKRMSRVESNNDFYLNLPGFILPQHIIVSVTIVFVLVISMTTSLFIST